MDRRRDGDDFGNGDLVQPPETKVALGNTGRLIIFDLVDLATARVLEIPEAQTMNWLDDETLVVATLEEIQSR